MANLTETARSFADAFEQRKRDNGDEFYSLKDGSPEWMLEAVRAAHGDMLPNDWSYRFAAHMASDIADAADNGEDFAEAIDTASDNLIPAYNGERLAWLASHLERAGLVDEAVSEFGWPADGGIFQAIAYGIQNELHTIGHSIADALNEQADEEFECDGCGRPEADCSADPCPDVIADREA
jgi:hypothetical protein